MRHYELFVERESKKEKGASPDVYRYDVLPEPLRTQIVLILGETIGNYRKPSRYDTHSTADRIWMETFERFRKELGRFDLGSADPRNPEAECRNFVLTGSTLEVLSLVELAIFVGANYERRSRLQQPIQSAIDELNRRFRQHAVGYQIDAATNQIFRIDSQYLHAEVVKPALNLLRTQGFEGAMEEFLKAHGHYREGRRKEAIVEALKAFESTMKAVCAVRGIAVDPRAGAGDLITLLLDRGILPKVLTSHLTGLRTALQSGVPTLRNKEAGHGQGAEVRDVPEYLVAHALHLAAANIVLIVEAHKNEAA